MFDIFPILGWITVAVAIVIKRAIRVSDDARETRATANVSLKWLLVPVILSWVLLPVADGTLWKTHVVLFLIELPMAVFIVRRYRAWVLLPELLAATCLVWSGGIALGALRSHPERIGPELRTARGGTQANVSASFKRRELALVLARAQQFAPSGALSEFLCGDTVPGFAMGVELRPGAEDHRSRSTDRSGPQK
ncbi:MAG: hypothetical protein ACJ796_05220 [Gemmatimonadaceae bacterium]